MSDTAPYTITLPCVAFYHSNISMQMSSCKRTHFSCFLKENRSVLTFGPRVSQETIFHLSFHTSCLSSLFRLRWPCCISVAEILCRVLQGWHRGKKTNVISYLATMHLRQLDAVYAQSDLRSKDVYTAPSRARGGMPVVDWGPVVDIVGSRYSWGSHLHPINEY